MSSFFIDDHAAKTVLSPFHSFSTKVTRWKKGRDEAKPLRKDVAGNAQPTPKGRTLNTYDENMKDHRNCTCRRAPRCRLGVSPSPLPFFLF